MIITLLVTSSMVLAQTPSHRTITTRPYLMSPPQSRPSSSSLSQNVPSELVEQRVQALVQQYRGDNAQCVEKLLALWNEYQRADYLPLVSACEVATGETASSIVDAIADTVGRPAAERRGLHDFFKRPNAAPLLASKLKNPEPLLRLAVDAGYWAAIPSFTCDQQIKQKYILEGIRKDRSAFCPVPSLAGVLSESSVPELKSILRDQLSVQGPVSGVVPVVVATLTEFGDTTILPDLDNLIREPRGSGVFTETYRLYAAKLRHQESVPDLLQIVRSERDSKRVLMWAVGRLLWLKTDKRTVYGALAANRDQGGQVAESVERDLRAIEEGRMSAATMGEHSGRLVLDPAELRNDIRASKAAKNVQEKAQLAGSLSLRALLASAPAGD